MTSFSSLLNNNAFSVEIQKCIKILATKKLQKIGYKFNKKVARYFCENLKLLGEESDRIDDDLQDAITNECLSIIKEETEKFAPILEESIDELKSGLCSYADVANKIASKALELLRYKINDKERDEYYKRLRQAIHRRRTKEGTRVFNTKFIKYGKSKMYLFSPENVDKIIIVKNLENPPKSLTPVDTKIFRVQGDEPEYNGKIVEQEAHRFWKAFIDEYNAGESCYAPLYGMYCWIAKSLVVVEQQPISISESKSDEECSDLELLQFLPSDENVEDDVNMHEVEELAKNYADTLSDEDTLHCAFFSKAPTLAEIANFLNLSGPSAAKRKRDKLFLRFREYITGQVPDQQSQMVFFRCLFEECQKRSPI